VTHFLATFQFFLISTLQWGNVFRPHFLSVLPYFDKGEDGESNLVSSFSSSLFRHSATSVEQITINLSVLPYFDLEDLEKLIQQEAFSSSLFRRIMAKKFKYWNDFQFFLISTRNTKKTWNTVTSFSSSLFRLGKWVPVKVTAHFQFFLISTREHGVYNHKYESFSSSLFRQSIFGQVNWMWCLSVLPYFDSLYYFHYCRVGSFSSSLFRLYGYVDLDRREVTFSSSLFRHVCIVFEFKKKELSVLPYFDINDETNLERSFSFQFFLIST